MPKIYFTSDLHLGHKNILKYTNREKVIGISMEDPEWMKKMDKWIIDMWNSTVDKEDTIYILGDFSFYSTEDTRKILEKLKGNKILIWGNHDLSCKGLENYFQYNATIREMRFKKSLYDFLDEDFVVELCHYPILSWNKRQYGSVMVHGHCHGNMDAYNKESKELRVDVGLDGELANYGLVSLEQIYNYIKKVTNGKLPSEYIKEKIINKEVFQG